MEMPGLWKGWKESQKAGFPPFPRAPWKSRQLPARFPHSHSSDDEGGRKSGKPRADFPLSYRPESLFLNQQTTAIGLALRRPAALRSPVANDIYRSVTSRCEATRSGILIVVSGT